MSDQKKSPRKFSPEFKLNVVLESYARGNVSATAEWSCEWTPTTIMLLS
ncbi:hypothetical protein ACFLZP_04015 [Patescibacteria group bacterium]